MTPEPSPATPADADLDNLIDRLDTHMGKADIEEVLRDCRKAATELQSLRDKLRAIVEQYDHVRLGQSISRMDTSEAEAVLHALMNDARNTLATIRSADNG